MAEWLRTCIAVAGVRLLTSPDWRLRMWIAARATAFIGTQVRLGGVVSVDDESQVQSWAVQVGNHPMLSDGMYPTHV